MLRDIAQVRAATLLVDADLRRVLGPEWSCAVDDDWVFTVSDGARVERSLLSDEVEDEAWYVDEAWSPEVQKEALEVDAMEAVANEQLEVLRAMGDAQLTCPEHGVALGACQEVWLCNVRPDHDVAFIGQLGTAEPFAGAAGSEAP